MVYRKYLIHNLVARLLLRCIDGCLALFFFSKKPLPVSPKRILLCHSAHLGDVILTTSLLPHLKRLFPHASISMLVGSWAKPLVEHHPLVDRVHVLDHWKHNRSSDSFGKKFLRYQRMKRAVIKEISSYDLSIDCTFHFPGFAWVLYRAKVSARIGFVSAGFSSLLTQAHPWTFLNQSVAASFVTLLDSYRNGDKTLLDLSPSIVMKEGPKLPFPYYVVHMGSGDQKKQWPQTKWRELIERLVEAGFWLVFTGKGEGEEKAIQEVCSGLENCLNLCNQLSWHEFVSVIHRSVALIGVDSAAGHVAAALNIPSVLLYTAVHPDAMWAPLSKKAVVLREKPACSPCHKGCPTMHCIRDIEVDRVYDAIVSLELSI